MKTETLGLKFDWITILIFFALVTIGWVNIYSASYQDGAKG
ncbi:MAG: rod shape determining protein RodA, partial [Patiriisocius sp.]